MKKNCEKGTRRNKKTGLCETITIKQNKVEKTTPTVPIKQKKCEKGTRRNKKTGLCEKNNVVENNVVENNVVENDAVEDHVVENDAVENNVVENDAVENNVVENDAVEDDAVEDDVVENDAVENNVVENDAVEDDVVEDDAVEDDAVEDDAVEDDAVEDDAVEDDAVEDDAVEDDAVENDAVENDAVENDAVENDDDYDKKNFEYNKSNNDYDFLYPDLNDPNFNGKIAKKKEFYDTQYDGTISDIKVRSDLLCNIEFELLPHQLFVRNFLSLQTPYNSLFLYHGLGSGKTCSAIGIAEEMRSYMKQMGFELKQSYTQPHHHIIVVASPDVQENFKKQLFDESKLEKNSSGIWNINSCVGNSLLNEINPAQVKGLSRNQVIANINTLIKSSYEFFGYIKFSHYASKFIKGTSKNEPQGKNDMTVQIKNAKKYFSNRLIIIDEVHNIRSDNDDDDIKVASKMLFQIVKHADNVRLLLLSATPMYNSYKEIIWITNLLNLNDKRSTIRVRDVFDNDGNFIENGRSLLKRKLTGYISYVRGENPYTFPFRIYPESFASNENKYLDMVKPVLQIDGKKIEKQLEYIQTYVTTITDYQKTQYIELIDSLQQQKNVLDEDVTKGFGYQKLQNPIQALNMTYPSSNGGRFTGTSGLEQIMKYTKGIGLSGKPERFDFEYIDKKKYGQIFHQKEIHKYSAKIAKICEIILKSTGIVLIFSQYIDGGLVPMALALEELGFSRYGSTNGTKSLFAQRKPPIKKIDAIEFKTAADMNNKKFNKANYVMITGDKFFSHNNSEDLEAINHTNNKYGENIKVVLISKSGSEGLDYKNIRQVHIMEPWFNMNRIEQIIGRAVRNLSHCKLPFEERNVELYLHASMIKDSNKECADLYIYRMAEKKAIQIGKVTRLLKECSVDCLLNIKQSNFTVENLNNLPANKDISIKLSSENKKIKYQIGDRPFTDTCDYMNKCEFECSGENDGIITSHTYNMDYVTTNNTRIMERIRQLFQEKKHSFTRNEIIGFINSIKPYPLEQIYSTLTYLVHNKNELLLDIHGRKGILENKDDIYIFQPIEMNDLNASLYDRSVPIENKRKNLIFENSKNEPKVSNNDYEKIVTIISDNIKNVFDSSSNSSDKDNYYVRSKKLVSILINENQIQEERLYEYFIFHYLDTMVFNDKLVLAKEIFTNKNLTENRINNAIKKYFDKRKIEILSNDFILLGDTFSNNLYKISDWSINKGNKGILNEYNVKEDKLNNSYIGYFSNEQNGSLIPVFKIQNRSIKKRKAVVIIEKAGKGIILNVLNIMKDELTAVQKTKPKLLPYNDENTKRKLFVLDLCILLEMIMRELNTLSEKRVFLTIEEILSIS
jgi:hypothetical protein